MLAKVLTTLAATAVALTFASSAQAATRGQATQRISACLEHAGATKITHGEGLLLYHAAHFGGPRLTVLGWDRFLAWGYITSDGGQVLGTITTYSRLTRPQKHAVNRCLQPFNGSLAR